MKRKFKNACDAYYWVYEHPELMYKFRHPWMELTPHMVNPKNRTVEQDESLNTHLEWWIEGGQHTTVYDFSKDGDVIPCHDWDLDTGGDTADEAVIKFALNVLEKYGDYEEKIITKEEVNELMKKLGMKK